MEIPDFTTQLQSLMPALGLGFILGLLYDFVRILRLILPSGRTVLFVTDALFVIFCFLASYLLLAAIANGHIRAYIVIAEILGAAVYSLTAGRLIFSAAEKTASHIKKFLKKIFSPFRALFSKMGSFFKGKIKNIKKYPKNFKKELEKR